jgi:hypothetical protein
MKISPPLLDLKNENYPYFTIGKDKGEDRSSNFMILANL